MGWSSYLEDISNRLQTNLDELKKHSHSSKMSSPKDIKKSSYNLTPIIKTAEILIQDINKLMEVATAPEIDLAYELQYLRFENKSLTESINEIELLRKQIEQYKQSYERIKNDKDKKDKEKQQLNVRYAKLVANHQEEIKQHEKLKKAFDRLRRAKGIH